MHSSGDGVTIAVASTFHVESVRAALDFWAERILGPARTVFAPFGQVFQSLLEPQGALRSNRGGVNVLCVRGRDLRADAVADLRSALAASVQASGAVHIVVICPSGAVGAPDAIDLALAEALQEVTGTDVVGAEELARLYPVENVVDAFAEREGQIPYTEDFFVGLGTTIARRMRVARTAPKKVLLVDCDDTLWGGVVGEVGVDGVVLDAPRLDFQRFLLEQRAQGMLLCLVSRNSEADVFEVFDRRSEMVLRREHITSWKIDWRPKGDGIGELAQELNLGVDSMVLFDDDAFVCQSCAERWPGLSVVQVPPRPLDLVRHLWLFDRGKVTAEDRTRAEAYRAESERQRERKQMSHADFLAKLELETRLSRVDDVTLARASQLTFRTNQFNASTRRRSEAEMRELAARGLEAWVVDVKDRFGDYGTTGLVIFGASGDALVVDTFLLSCRVLGRGVEDSVVQWLGRTAMERQISSVALPYAATKKNAPYAAFFEQLPGVRDASSGTATATVASEALAAHRSRVPTAEVPAADATAPAAGSADRLDHVAVARNLSSVAAIRAAMGAPSRATGVDASLAESVAAIWAQVLALETVEADVDLFDAGGDSLAALQILSRIVTTYGVEIPMHELFEARATVAWMTERIVQGREPEAAPVAPSAAADPKLERVDRAKPAPVSFGQARLWFLDQYEGGSATYNVPTARHLAGRVDASALDRAFREVVRRHEALRTRFVVVDGEPHQLVVDADARLERREASSRDAARRIVAEESLRPFDLTKGLLARLVLVSIGPEEHILLINIHHIATDGWSFGIVTDDLARFYEAYTSGAELARAPLPFGYADFAAWQRRVLTGPALETQLAFWTNALAGAPAALELPTDLPRPAIRSTKGGAVSFQLEARTVAAMRAYCRETGTTPSMVLLAVYSVLLGRWSGQRDIVVGTPVANRANEAFESIVGLFVNTLPLRVTFADDTTFAELVQHVRDRSLAAYAHQELPFERLVEELRAPRDLSRTPVYQTMFTVLSMAREKLAFPGVSVSEESFDFDVSRFDLSLMIDATDESYRAMLQYDAALFERSTAVRLAAEFETLLSNVLAAPGTAVTAAPLLPQAERALIVEVWNRTDADLGPDLSLHELFAQQALRTPDAPAVADAETSLSYRELDERSARVAGWLVAHGVGRHDRVAVSVERSVDMLAATLGVMKAGAAYVPIDPKFPEDRRDFMRKQSECRVELTDLTLADAVAAAPLSAPVTVAPNDLAYVLFTSGSTGRPKGVMVEHRNLVSFLRAMARTPGISATDRLVAVTTLSFDIAGLELYLPIVTGACTVVATHTEAGDPRALAAFLSRQRATMLQATPATWRMLLADGWRPASDFKMLCGGEAITPDLVAVLTAGGAELWNMYGPTETTIWSTCVRLHRKEEISIGRPIANTRVYVLDERGEPTPIGVPGHLHIAGAGVARGYLGRDDLTAERFLPELGRPGDRMYATGDLARWRADGTIEYLGRLDHQVKVRGFRIELGEIEAVLGEQAGVRQAVVAVHGSDADKRIVAYVVEADPAADFHRDRVPALLAGLRGKLPEYMLPATFMPLEALPLTPNGKVDRKRLPVPDFAAAASEYVAPRTAIEHGLTEIWQELLVVPRVGIHDDFFALGGHSLLATRSASMIQSRLGIGVPVRVLFEASTIADLAPRLEALGSGDGAVPVARAADARRGPLSPNQLLWWERHLEQPSSPRLLYVEVYRLSGPLDRARLEHAFEDAFARHHALRTIVQLEPDGPVQLVEDPPRGVVQYVDLRGQPPDAADALFARERAHHDARERIGRARVTLAQVGDEDHRVVIGFHRVLVDPVLAGVLMTEALATYRALLEGAAPPLEAPPFQYLDYVAWQRKLLETAPMRDRLAAMRTRLAEVEPTALPFDHPHPTEVTARARPMRLAHDAQVWKQVEELARAEATSKFVVFSALFGAWLREVTEQDRVVFVAPNELARGQDAAFGATFGCFFNYFVIVIDASGEPSLREMVRRAHKAVNEAYANVDLPSALLTNTSDLGPLTRAALNYVPDLESWHLPRQAGLEVALITVGPPHRMVDFAWLLFGTKSILAASFDKFTEETATRLAESLRAFVSRTLSAPDALV